MNSDDILDTLPTGLVVLDKSYRIKRWNHWMTVHSGLSREHVLDRSVFNFYPSLNRSSFLRACKTVFTFGNVVYLSQKLHHYLFPFEPEHTKHSPFQFMQQRCTMSPVRGESNTVEHVAITVQDVTEHVVLVRRLRLVNNLDELTGAYNRRYLDERLHEEFDRSRRYERTLSICIIDLDHFKETNDELGHLAGDQALVDICAIVQSELRDIDVLARFGGEEFVCVLPETSQDEARIVAERIRERVATSEFSWKDRRFSMTASLGVAELDATMQTPDELLEAADSALYVAKERRNRVAAKSG